MCLVGNESARKKEARTEVCRKKGEQESSVGPMSARKSRMSGERETLLNDQRRSEETHTPSDAFLPLSFSLALSLSPAKVVKGWLRK